MIFTNEAYECWVNAYNEIECEIAPDGRYRDIKPTASKMAEIIARIAGILSVIDEGGEVAVSHVESARLLGLYYLDQSLAIFSPKNKGEDSPALNLLQWIKDKRPNGVFRPADFSFVPRSIGRSAETLRLILNDLTKLGYLVAEYNYESGDARDWEKPIKWVVIDQ